MCYHGLQRRDLLDLSVMVFFHLLLVSFFSNDYKQILSCVGAINDEMSIVLWSCERRQVRQIFPVIE